MAIADSTPWNACAGMATPTATSRGPTAAIADFVGYLAVDDGCLLQCGQFLSPILPVNVCPGHMRSLWYRSRRDVAGLQALRLARLAVAASVDTDGT